MLPALSEFFERQAFQISTLSSELGSEVSIDEKDIFDRSPYFDLSLPTTTSANGTCHLLKASDGWIALNLAREEDWEFIPALTQRPTKNAPWEALQSYIANETSDNVVSRGRVMGLPIAKVDEYKSRWSLPTSSAKSFGSQPRTTESLQVVDLTSMWAAPLCGCLFSRLGATVCKVESDSRPDGIRASPEFFEKLNGNKDNLELRFETKEGLLELRDLVAEADVLITNSRFRAFAALGLDVDFIFANNPNLVWIAVSGYGISGVEGEWVAFGDDAAAAAGLVRWTEKGEPHFVGDALADPITGVVAFHMALQAIKNGGGYFIDAPLARCTAQALIGGGK